MLRGNKSSRNIFLLWAVISYIKYLPATHNGIFNSCLELINPDKTKSQYTVHWLSWVL